MISRDSEYQLRSWAATRMRLLGSTKYDKKGDTHANMYESCSPEFLHPGQIIYILGKAGTITVPHIYNIFVLQTK